MKLPTINKESQKGFTLVELIIVIVVIGILAAIILVAYGNVTTRANASAAKQNAGAVLNFAEVYHADKGSYPTISQVQSGTTDSAQLPSGLSGSSHIVATAPTSSSAKDVITYLQKSTTGVCVGYYDPSAPGVAWQYGGDASSVSGTTCS